jgi:hypothetical protein
MLADQLNLNLICYGEGGQPWWGIKLFLKTLSEEQIENCEAVVFAHTNTDRFPTCDIRVGKVDKSKLLNNKDEFKQALGLYYKYLHESSFEFLYWAHQKWFEEVSITWSHTKIINLHCFPWTWELRHLLKGTNMSPSLLSISLNELGDDTKSVLFNDHRPNHFSMGNNKVLADQLADMIKNYEPGDKKLDLSKFYQRTNKWADPE